MVYDAETTIHTEEVVILSVVYDDKKAIHTEEVVTLSVVYDAKTTIHTKKKLLHSPQQPHLGPELTIATA
jgi:hypothetical protein